MAIPISSFKVRFGSRSEKEVVTRSLRGIRLGDRGCSSGKAVKALGKSKIILCYPQYSHMPRS